MSTWTGDITLEESSDGRSYFVCVECRETLARTDEDLIKLVQDGVR